MAEQSKLSKVVGSPVLPGDKTSIAGKIMARVFGLTGKKPTKTAMKKERMKAVMKEGK